MEYVLQLLSLGLLVHQCEALIFKLLSEFDLVVFLVLLRNLRRFINIGTICSWCLIVGLCVLVVPLQPVCSLNDICLK